MTIEEALALVADKLERGELRHKRLVNGGERGEWFNMGHWDTETENCGTVCCIGGWAERLSGIDLLGGIRSDELEELFFPWIDVPLLIDITPEQAARAIRNYLRTGRANWKEATS